MKTGNFTQVINILSELTHHQLTLLKDKVDSKVNESETYRQIDQCKKNDSVACPHCGSMSIGRWGIPFCHNQVRRLVMDLHNARDISIVNLTKPHIHCIFRVHKKERLV